MDFSTYDIIRDDMKNEKLIRERGIGFQMIKEYIFTSNMKGIIDNPSKNHPSQKLIIIEIKNYPYAVPCLIVENLLILKTIFPCRDYKNL